MNEKHLRSIITAYKKLREEKPDIWLNSCAHATNIQNAIKLAATARNLADMKHPHQYRIPVNVLNHFADNLISIQNQLSAVSTFNDLLALVEKSRIKGIADLTIYDTSLRIGMFLNIYPVQVYLHSGTRVGAEILLGKIRGRYINIEQLPPAFHELSALEIEDLLCIYKERLRNLRN